MALTPKQQRFVEEYPIDLDLTAAYKRAGYKTTSDEAARTAAHRLLRNVTVLSGIEAAIKSRNERTKLTQDEVINGLRFEAKDRGEGSQHSARVKAWELLGKHQGMFPEKHHHGGDPDNPTPIQHTDAVSNARRTELDSLIAALRERAGSGPAGIPLQNGTGNGKPL